MGQRLAQQLGAGERPAEQRLDPLTWSILEWPILEWPILEWPILAWRILAWRILAGLIGRLHG